MTAAATTPPRCWSLLSMTATRRTCAHRCAHTPSYGSAYSDEQALETALILRHELDSDVPLVVALSRSEGVTRLIGDAKSVGAPISIDVFPTLGRVCTVELVKGGSFEVIATAIHR